MNDYERDRRKRKYLRDYKSELGSVDRSGTKTLVFVYNLCRINFRYWYEVKFSLVGLG